MSLNGRTAAVAESALLKLLARVMMVIGTPLLVALILWVASTLISVPEQLTSIRGVINVRALELASEIGKLGEKVEAQGEINRHQDRRLERLEDRLNGGGPR